MNCLDCFHFPLRPCTLFQTNPASKGTLFSSPFLQSCLLKTMSLIFSRRPHSALTFRNFQKSHFFPSVKSMHFQGFGISPVCDGFSEMTSGWVSITFPGMPLGQRLESEVAKYYLTRLTHTELGLQFSCSDFFFSFQIQITHFSGKNGNKIGVEQFCQLCCHL